MNWLSKIQKFLEYGAKILALLEEKGLFVQAQAAPLPDDVDESNLDEALASMEAFIEELESSESEEEEEVEEEEEEEVTPPPKKKASAPVPPAKAKVAGKVNLPQPAPTNVAKKKKR